MENEFEIGKPGDEPVSSDNRKCSWGYPISAALNQSVHPPEKQWGNWNVSAIPSARSVTIIKNPGNRFWMKDCVIVLENNSLRAMLKVHKKPVLDEFEIICWVLAQR
jgi:hypothetical protein